MKKHILKNEPQLSFNSKETTSTEKLESIIALPHTAPYKIHKYFARRPWNVFEKIIKTYTSPGNLILDPFMGGGVTVYEGLKLGRKVIGFDLNPLSHFIVKAMIQTDLEINRIDYYFKQIIDQFTSKIDLVSSKKDKDTLWRELTYEVECNHCGTKTFLSNELKVGPGRYQCINLECKSKLLDNACIKPKDCRRLGITYLFSIQKNRSGILKSIKIDTIEKKRILSRLDSLIDILEVESEIKVRTPIPKNWDRQKEDLLESKGFLNFEDFFTPTNFALNLGLKKIIKNIEIPDNYRMFFRLVFSSSIRDTNVMAFTNDGWQSGKPTTWSKHAYWIPSQFCEVNVVEAFTRSFKRSRSALKYSLDLGLKPSIENNWSNKKDCSAYVINGNLSESKIPNNSVDAIITDPPYGSNVQYLELSHFWLPWNIDIYDVTAPNFSQEAISNRKKDFDGAKSMIEYEENLHVVFQKSFDVLKPGGVLTLTFNNKDMGAWLALLISIFKSGYEISPKEIYFQDGVKNYKQTSHTKAIGSLYGDFIYIFRKPIKEVFYKKELKIKDFILKMDAIFLTYSNSSTSVIASHENQLDCFVKSIDLIKSIAKKSLSRKDKENLFKHFNKKYLEKFFDKT